jgi:hypothetical protein
MLGKRFLPVLSWHRQTPAVPVDKLPISPAEAEIIAFLILCEVLRRESRFLK